MNRRLVINLLGAILLIEAAAMLPAFLIALGYGDGDASALAKSMALLLAVGLPMRLLARPASRSPTNCAGALLLRPPSTKARCSISRCRNMPASG